MNEESKMAWLTRVRANGLTLAEAPEWARDDEDIVVAAVVSDPDSLEFATERQKGSGAVSIAISKDGMALRHAVAPARDNREICREAVWRNGMALQYVSPPLRADLDVVLAAVRANPAAARFINEELIMRAGVAEEIAECDAATLEFLPLEVANRPAVAAAAARASARAAKHTAFGSTDLKTLISVGLAHGYVTYDQIIEHAPAFALSKHEIAGLADLLEYECHVDVFAHEPTETERKDTRVGRLHSTFRELFRQFDKA